MQPDRLDEIASSLGELKDLFQRRLLEDRTKTKMFEELQLKYSNVQSAEAQVSARALFNEILLVVDRLRSVDGPNDATAADELEEMLRRREIHRMLPADIFDPRFHEAARSEHSTEVEYGGIIRTLRDGFFVSTEVLRPALVLVSLGNPPGVDGGPHA